MTAASLAWSVPSDHPSLAGHFPGRPILPGVVLLAVVTEALLADATAAARIGAAPRLGAVKFLSTCLPGDRVRFAWRHEAGRVAFEARRLHVDGSPDDTACDTEHDPEGSTSALVLGGHFVVTAA